MRVSNVRDYDIVDVKRCKTIGFLPEMMPMMSRSSTSNVRNRNMYRQPMSVLKFIEALDEQLMLRERKGVGSQNKEVYREITSLEQGFF
jgi:hypothetical protein